jgi:hypothetical protein
MEMKAKDSISCVILTLYNNQLVVAFHNETCHCPNTEIYLVFPGLKDAPVSYLIYWLSHLKISFKL